MIDYEVIGKRILEQRKYLHRLSQEKMAEDLGMYQADISNLEKAKNGSGITDLTKLEMIADYFDMPLETLLFGRRHEQMEKYYGNKMQLKETTKKPTKKHKSILRKLIGLPANGEEDAVLDQVHSYECGPYTVYIFYEQQQIGDATETSMFKTHVYVVYQDEVIGCLSAYNTSVMSHVFEPAFEAMKKFIWRDIFDLEDTLEVLNPYLILYRYSPTDEVQEETMQMMYKRMDALRDAGENRTIFYVETLYVREDCRRSGICRMLLDVLKKLDKGAIIWLSLEPTSGEGLDHAYREHALYESSELGQMTMNASIAERLGFTVDSKTVTRQAERVEEDGSVVFDEVDVRRTAYFLPKRIRTILNGDARVLAYARSLKKTMLGDKAEPVVRDIFQGAWKKYGFIMAIRVAHKGQTVYAFARGMDWKSRWLGVSKENPADTGEYVETIEKYDKLADATGSQYYDELMVAEQLLGAIFFGTVRHEDVQMELL